MFSLDADINLVNAKKHACRSFYSRYGPETNDRCVFCTNCVLLAYVQLRGGLAAPSQLSKRRTEEPNWCRVHPGIRITVALVREGGGCQPGIRIT